MEAERLEARLKELEQMQVAIERELYAVRAVIGELQNILRGDACGRINTVEADGGLGEVDEMRDEVDGITGTDGT